MIWTNYAIRRAAADTGVLQCILSTEQQRKYPDWRTNHIAGLFAAWLLDKNNAAAGDTLKNLPKGKAAFPVKFAATDALGEKFYKIFAAFVRDVTGVLPVVKKTEGAILDRPPTDDSNPITLEFTAGSGDPVPTAWVNNLAPPQGRQDIVCIGGALLSIAKNKAAAPVAGSS
jgi:hypothetical protein